MSDTVRIEGVRGHGAHGVLPEEKRRAQPFVVDVEMEVEPAAARSHYYLTLIQKRTNGFNFLDIHWFW